MNIEENKEQDSKLRAESFAKIVENQQNIQEEEKKQEIENEQKIKVIDLKEEDIIQPKS